MFAHFTRKSLLSTYLVLALCAFYIGGPGEALMAKKGSKSLGAIVTKIQGKTLVERDGSTLNARKNMLLKENDILAVQEGILHFQLGTGTICRLEAGSTLTLSQFILKGGKANILLNLKRGPIFIKVDRKDYVPSNVKVTTPTTVAAVRGTYFLTEVTSRETRFLVDEGKVEVTPLKAVAGKPTSNYISGGYSLRLRGDQSIRAVLTQQDRARLAIFADYRAMKREIFLKLYEQLRRNEENLNRIRGNWKR